MWYDQFTSTDWVRDSIADGYRVRELQKRRDWRGRVWLFFDSVQGWILVAIIGGIVALIAYLVDILEAAIADFKLGYCEGTWYQSHVQCCQGRESCTNWHTWSNIVRPKQLDSKWIDYAAFITGGVVLAVISCSLTLLSRTVVPSHIVSTLDEDLAAESVHKSRAHDKDTTSTDHDVPLPSSAVYYSAAGSGVAEVKVILSGFVLHGYLGAKTLVLKVPATILSVASGMSIGKEGPYVHIATCVGNIACRLFAKYNLNDGKRREVLSASAASGVAVAFGAPLGGFLFSLEEVSYYFPPKTLFRTFFCCVVAALTLKFLNPYGTSKIVLFQVRYLTDWHYFELVNFVILGVAGGVAGALFIKASRVWARTFRRIPIIKAYPMLEVVLVALVTGIAGFWNRYTKLSVTELLLEVSSPCGPHSHTGLCPAKDEIPGVIGYLTTAFVIKAFLTIIAFGIKVPSGIYVPSMVVGGLMGRIMGHVVQLISLTYPDFFLFANCSRTGGTEACVTPGVYALVAAGATMCGVTRLSVTLAVILFELTGSLDHVLPFSLAVLVAKWTADAVERLSIYDLLTTMNSYPFLDNKVHPVFDSELRDLAYRVRPERMVDISSSSLVSAAALREKAAILKAAGELDGAIPIIRHEVLVGLIPVPDLEYALDQVDLDITASDTGTNDGEIMCLLYRNGNEHAHNTHHLLWSGFADEEGADSLAGPASVGYGDPIDLTPYVDPSPVALDVHSPMDLVYQCFVKLGLRYICVTEEGMFAGMVHKKAFVRYVRELELER